MSSSRAFVRTVEDGKQIVKRVTSSRCSRVNTYPRPDWAAGPWSAEGLPGSAWLSVFWGGERGVQGRLCDCLVWPVGDEKLT